MRRVFIAVTYATLSTTAIAGDATQQIEEIVVTGAVRSNEAIEIAAIDFPGDAELTELPIAPE